MDRVKWNDFMEILSDDLNRSGDYLIEGFQAMVSDFITNCDVTVGLAVTAQAVPDMSVYVKSGRLYQQGKQGTLEADSNALVIAAAHNTYPRIDRIVAQYQELEDLPETRNVMVDVVSRNIAQQTVKTRIAGTIAFQVLQGVAAASPVPVNVPEGWVALAKINVPANVTTIQQSNIISEAPRLFGLLNHNHNGAGGGQKISYKDLTDTPALVTIRDIQSNIDDHDKDANAHSAVINKHNTNASAHSDFKGATASAVGKRGMVPAPAKGKQNAVLAGNGEWKDADSIDMTPVGDVVFRPFLKAGYVKANGATVNRADYPRLVAFATANNLWTSSPSTEPWKFGRGNGSSTMVLPNYVGRFIQGGDSCDVKQSGLPNITGWVAIGAEVYEQYIGGAFWINDDAAPVEGHADGDNNGNIGFDASRVNPIYGRSSIVQPPSIQLIPQLRY